MGGISKFKRDYTDRELDELQKDIDIYNSKSLEHETKTIDDFIKNLSIANTTAATVSIGYLQTIKDNVIPNQYHGSICFVIGIICILILMIISEINASRTRYRFQDAKNKFDANQVMAHEFDLINDCKSNLMRWITIILRYLSFILFIVGLILFLMSVNV